MARIHFDGTYRDRMRGAAELAAAISATSARRLVKGPRLPRWNWFLEVATRLLRKRLNTAFDMPNVEDARRYLDTLIFDSPVLDDVIVTPVEPGAIRGAWYVPKRSQPVRTALYLHGGGFCFYPCGYASFVAQLTLAFDAKVFALDYRLTPEHCYPAQLHDALAAYRWLLARGVRPEELIVGGDSAGANLAMALLLAGRDQRLPQPALAVALSPPTDMEHSYPSLIQNQEFDWLEMRMLSRWSDWYCEAARRADPLVTIMRADLRGLCPIYIQAGTAEIFYDSIHAFIAWAQSQHADVVFDAWEDMNHDFQMFGGDVPQSAEALRRLREVVSAHVPPATSPHPLAVGDRMP
jgi:epsilon-lactone hydrolase